MLLYTFSNVLNRLIRHSYFILFVLAFFFVGGCSFLQFFCQPYKGVIDHSTITRYFQKFTRIERNSMIRQDQVGLKAWITMMCSKPLKQIHQVAFGEYQARSVSHSRVWFLTFTASANPKLHSESIKRARYLTVGCSSKPSRHRQIHWVAFRDYQSSSASHCPVWFVTFTDSAKASGAVELCLILQKYRKTFDSSLNGIGSIELWYRRPRGYSLYVCHIWVTKLTTTNICDCGT